MEDLIRNIAERLGLDEETAQSVVGSLLSLVRDTSDEKDANALFDQLPGAKELVESQQEGDSGGGGGLMDMLGGMLGGSLGSAMSVFSQLQGKGLDMSQIGEAGKGLFEYLQQNLDSDLVQRIVGQLADKIPGLDNFIGNDDK